MSNFERKPIPTDRCRHILSKNMLVFGEEYEAPEDELDQTEDFWCSHTQTVLGPDRGLVILAKCVPSRPCFEEL